MNLVLSLIFSVTLIVSGTAFYIALMDNHADESGQEYRRRLMIIVATSLLVGGVLTFILIFTKLINGMSISWK